MKKTIILFITKLELGGAQKVCLSLFEDLKKNGSHVFLLSGCEGYFVSHYKDDPSVILLKNLHRECSPKTLFADLKTIWDLYSFLRQHVNAGEQVILHSHSTKAGILGRIAAFFARVPRIHTIHGFAFHEGLSWGTWMIRYLSEFIVSLIPSHAIFVSKKDLHFAEKKLPLLAKTSSIIRAATSISLPTTAPVKKIASTIIIGTISCFKPQKNLIDLLIAFKKARHALQDRANLTLEIVGDGVERPLIEEFIIKNELANSITLFGWQEDVIPFLNRWHIFSLSSLWEGLPCTIIEARMYKLPIIAYNTGGISEIVKNHLNGFLAQQKNIAQLASYLTLTCSNEILYESLSEFKDELDQFSQETMLIQHHKLYASLFNERKNLHTKEKA